MRPPLPRAKRGLFEALARDKAAEIARLAAEAARSLGCGGAGLEGADAVIRAGMLKLGGGMLGQLLAADPGYRGPPVPCGQRHEAKFVSYYGDIDRICRAARAYPLEGIMSDELDTALGYFENNAPRMRYRWFRQCGLFVGSGVVEPAASRSSASASNSQACTRPPPARTPSPPCAAGRPTDPKTGSGPHRATRRQPLEQPDPLNDLGHLQI